MKKLTLYELQDIVKTLLDNNLDSSYWVTAEINELKINSGHCYLELVQKDKDNNYITAKIQAFIWAYQFNMLRPYFETATGRPLAAGMQVLVKTRVQHHHLYGLSLSITDIDPVYTVGELQIQKNRVIAELQNAGIFDMNKALDFPILPKRIAVISSSKAAGYRDFISHLANNTRGYKFEIQLFDSLMQGRDAERSIIDNLDLINQNANKFDVVAIIRGGGSQSDLSCFDSFDLASNIAQFTLPCITGIGHDKDTSIADLVAHKMLKTPTAVADFIIECFMEAEAELISFEERINSLVLEFVQIQSLMLADLLHKTKTSAKQGIYKEKIKLDEWLPSKVNSASLKLISAQKHKLEGFELKTKIYDPASILKRGYSITLHNGKRLTGDNLPVGEIIETILFNKTIKSEVING